MFRLCGTQHYSVGMSGRRVSNGSPTQTATAAPHRLTASHEFLSSELILNS